MEKMCVPVTRRMCGLNWPAPASGREDLHEKKGETKEQMAPFSWAGGLNEECGYE